MTYDPRFHLGKSTHLNGYDYARKTGERFSQCRGERFFAPADDSARWYGRNVSAMVWGKYLPQCTGERFFAPTDTWPQRYGRMIFRNGIGERFFAPKPHHP